MELPKELVEKIYKLISSAKIDGKIRRGANEATKSLERGEAKLVAYAADVSPAEITMHFKPLGKEKSIPIVAVPAKSELGAAAGLPVGTAAVAIANSGEAKKLLLEVTKSLQTMESSKAPAAKAEEKNAVPKEESKPEEKPAAEEPKEEIKSESKEEKAHPEEEPKEEAEAKEKAKPEEEPKEEKTEEKAKPEEEPKSE